MLYMMVQTCNSDIQEAQENKESKDILSYIVNLNQTGLYETVSNQANNSAIQSLWHVESEILALLCHILPTMLLWGRVPSGCQNKQFQIQLNSCFVLFFLFLGITLWFLSHYVARYVLELNYIDWPHICRALSASASWVSAGMKCE